LQALNSSIVVEIKGIYYCKTASKEKNCFQAPVSLSLSLVIEYNIRSTKRTLWKDWSYWANIHEIKGAKICKLIQIDWMYLQVLNWIFIKCELILTFRRIIWQSYYVNTWYYIIGILPEKVIRQVMILNINSCIIFDKIDIVVRTLLYFTIEFALLQKKYYNLWVIS
jgi:hypothetical protein